MQTVSAKASTLNQSAAIASRPRELITVTAPKASGTPAATGERKTSSRTISRIGRAISSPRSVAAIESSWIARERVAYPVCVQRTGGRTFAARIPFSSSTVWLTASSIGTWKSAITIARRGPGRRRWTTPRSQGERVVTAGLLRRSARTSCGPCRSSCRSGPRRRITKGALSPKWRRSILVARADGRRGFRGWSG